MDSIKKEAMEIEEKMGDRHLHHRNSLIMSADSSRPFSTGKNTMVGFDDALLEILDKLTGGDPGRQVIPIVGMGGMGKTTLARNVYVSPLIEQYFDICAWTIISQEYDAREILREVFHQVNKEKMRDMGEDELGEKLYKQLSGRRYLIVLDDMWSIEAWYKVGRFFPDNNNGSRIVLTTRLSNLASQLNDSYCLEMEFLDEDMSWDLLCKTVFGEEGCPLEIEKIGKKIVKNCRGLPLSIVVTGGLLVKSKHSHEYWEYIAENLNSLVNSEDNERCLNILYMSYKEMPIYLKPCFLYMGIFSEDYVIGATMLIRLWVAEGFLKPKSSKSLEEIAEECLEELIDRNLVHASRHVRKIKECSIHDLLRDLCLREAQKERFYYVAKIHSSNASKGIASQRRIGIHTRTSADELLYEMQFLSIQSNSFSLESAFGKMQSAPFQRRIFNPESTFEKEEVEELQSMSLARSLICEDIEVPLSLDFRLLRILDAFKKNIVYSEHPYLLENMFGLVNSRYFNLHVNSLSKFPSSVCLLWNLQMLTITPGRVLTAPAEIWMMPQLRHVKFIGGLYLPDPPRKDDDIVVLTNLQSLSTIIDFKFSEEVIKRIPNLKKLRIYYYQVEGGSHYFLNNVDRLHKLESFWCDTYLLPKPIGADLLSFPHSLKKLTLKPNHVQWDEMMEKIGSLPLLQVLKLTGGSVKGRVWKTVEDQFSSLKFLSISMLKDLEHWNLESTHFPCLEQLVLEYLHDLKEIPSDIGEITTLESIELTHCSYSAAVSARKILEEQEEFGDVTLQVRVVLPNLEKYKALESLASANFHVQYF